MVTLSNSADRSARASRSLCSDGELCDRAGAKRGLLSANGLRFGAFAILNCAPGQRVNGNFLCVVARCQISIKLSLSMGIKYGQQWCVLKRMHEDEAVAPKK